MARAQKFSRTAVCVAVALSAAMAAPSGAIAQAAPAAPPQQAAPLDQGQLAQLVAPIALYPDALLSQVLMASTYPLDVVEASRWRKANPGLGGADLEAALADQDWDASVKSLVAFPDVLAMMNDRLSWTQQLGDAFLSQQPALMDQVQALRARAQAAGNLRDTPQQTVVMQAPPEGGPAVISIRPAEPDVVYVPVYDPAVAYGAWAYPAYPPYYWYPPGYVATGAVLAFGTGLFIGNALWGGYDWVGHRVRVVDVHRYNGFNHTHYNHVRWHFDPGHRGHVGYGHGMHGGGHGRPPHVGARPGPGPRPSMPHHAPGGPSGPGGGFGGGHWGGGHPGGGHPGGGQPGGSRPAGGHPGGGHPVGAQPGFHGGGGFHGNAGFHGNGGFHGHGGGGGGGWGGGHGGGHGGGGHGGGGGHHCR